MRALIVIRHDTYLVIMLRLLSFYCTYVDNIIYNPQAITSI